VVAPPAAVGRLLKLAAGGDTARSAIAPGEVWAVETMGGTTATLLSGATATQLDPPAPPLLAMGAQFVDS